MVDHVLGAPRTPSADDIAALIARSSIADLVARYAAGADGRAAQDVGALFTDDAELVLPDPPRDLEPCRPITGRPAIVESLRGLESVPVSLHAVLGQVIDLHQGDVTASGIVTGAAHHLVDDETGPIDHVWHLHYRDRYALADGRWRFRRRELRIDWTERRPVRRRALGALPWMPEPPAPAITKESQ